MAWKAILGHVRCQSLASSLILETREWREGREPWNMQLFRCFHIIQGVSNTAEVRPLRSCLGVCCLACSHQFMRAGHFHWQLPFSFHVVSLMVFLFVKLYKCLVSTSAGSEGRVKEVPMLCRNLESIQGYEECWVPF
ncbi:uncharacterized protein LOC124651475 [Lolium rigidum]|uniref:uncharacterized protein LOC124651475 n=1 Tax=Lolium rigidum TaxID=89674 RepID=UPI001F5D0D55|nr:uncharacterized protein LOC124651475 [Lolium rigidum]